MLEKDAILAKISIIKNCLNTIQKATIDMANIIIAMKGWRLPASYKDSFKELLKQKVIDQATFEQMSKMVGFRNIAVHEYQELNRPILASILKNNLKDLEHFTFYQSLWPKALYL